MEHRNDIERRQESALAMAYVLWQGWERMYDESTALERGTVFPSLHLPFTGREVRS